MEHIRGPEPVTAAVAVVSDDNHSGPGRILSGIFETLDRAGIPYCVLHGYERFSQQITSDVDCMVSDDVRPHQLAALFTNNRENLINADLVYWRDYCFAFAGRNVDGSRCFLWLDLGVDYNLSNLKVYSGKEILEGRQRYRQFWVPVARIEFGCYLIRKIAKMHLDQEQGRRLSALYGRDPVGCQQRMAPFWGAKRVSRLAYAARSGDWGQVRGHLRSLRAEMRCRTIWRHPWWAIRGQARRIGQRARLVCWPEGGLIVVFLGPDGVGKSSVIAAVALGVAGAFNRTARYGFAPGLLTWLRRPSGANAQPHAVPPRSAVMSIVRAVCYWLVYYLLCYRLRVRLQLARSTLVMHDRHLIDALVDPKRYRYGGPMWLLRVIWRFVPQPDLIVLLDAPPEVLQARKQEVPFEESARQREAYRSLVRSMENGHVVDSTRPLEQVVGDVSDIILGSLSARIARRLRRNWNKPPRTSARLEANTPRSPASTRR